MILTPRTFRATITIEATEFIVSHPGMSEAEVKRKSLPTNEATTPDELEAEVRATLANVGYDDVTVHVTEFVTVHVTEFEGEG